MKSVDHRCFQWTVRWPFPLAKGNVKICDISHSCTAVSQLSFLVMSIIYR